MAYTHLLVAIAVTPESQQLLEKAIDIARPFQARITLITLVTDPELYTQLAGPTMENVREMLQEETTRFLDELIKDADYPIANRLIASGKLTEHILHIARSEGVDLVICGNHNQSLVSRAACSAKGVVQASEVDVLLVPLGA